MRHRHGADDGPTPGLWDDAAARARRPDARPPPRRRGTNTGPGAAPTAGTTGTTAARRIRKDYLPRDPVRWWNYIFVAIPFAMFHRIIHTPTTTTTRFRSGLHDRRALRATLPTK